jgi:hypothetical protein
MIAAMIPVKTSSVFKSRWMALLWAAGIIWFAYDTASSQPQGDANSTNAEQTDITGTPVTPEDQKKVEDALKSF